jgi:hypothetical protein
LRAQRALIARRAGAAAFTIAASYTASIWLSGGYRLGAGPIAIEIDAVKLWPGVAASAVAALVWIAGCATDARTAAREHPASIIFLVALIAFLGNGRTLSGGDSVPAKMLAQTVLRDRSFHLDRFIAPPRTSESLPYYAREAGGHVVSDYPVGAALFALPFFAPAVAAGVAPDARIFAELEKISAAAIAAASVAILYLAACEIAAPATAAIVALIFAFGTSTFSISSQALWQHGPANLALTVAIYCLMRGRRDPRWIKYAGFALAAEVITRPVDIVIAAPLAVCAMIHSPREFKAFALAAIPPIAFQLWYNAHYFGNPIRVQFFAQPADALGQLASGVGLWTTPLFFGLGSVLTSPGRGLLFYSPVLAFGFAGFIREWRRGGDPIIRALSVGAVAMVIIDAKWNRWTGGNSYGPRLLADLAPALAIAICPMREAIAQTRALRIGFVAAVIWSVTAHAIGTYSGDLGWNVWALQDPNRRMWLWSDNPVVAPFVRVADSVYIRAANLKTSADPDADLRASVDYEPTSMKAVIGAPLHLRIRAHNTGKAVWIARRNGERGAVSIRWRFAALDRGPPTSSGLIAIHRDVFAGDVFEFDIASVAPRSPDEYRVEVEVLALDGAGGSRTIASVILISAHGY